MIGIDRELMQEAINTWGVEKQFDQAIEEMAELIVELQHLKRNMVRPENVAAEVADVLICMAQLEIILGEDLVQSVVVQKQARLSGRVRGNPIRRDT